MGHKFFRSITTVNRRCPKSWVLMRFGTFGVDVKAVPSEGTVLYYLRAHGAFSRRYPALLIFGSSKLGT
jgi:hypothetical protein